MERHELEAWLGDDHGLADDQIDHLLGIANDIEDRFPDPDYGLESDAALTTAYRLLIEPNEEVIYELEDQLSKARHQEARAIAGLKQAALTVLAPGAGDLGYGTFSENEFAHMAGVDRMTVRKWLGKR